MNHRSLLLACIAALAFALPAAAEDGYDLWLRYEGLGPDSRAELLGTVHEVVPGEKSSLTLDATRAELLRGLSALRGKTVDVATAPTRAGAVVFGTPRSSSKIAKLPLG